MDTAKIEYRGDLRTEVTHLKSGQQLLTDAPTDNHGLGESISPTDMVAAATVSCMMTIMGITARKNDMALGNVAGTVEKTMAAGPRRIIALRIELKLADHQLSDAEKARLETAALSCPVVRSLHPDIAVNVKFTYQD
jgi:putative redox protein